MRAFILAGGLGTRLRPVVDGIPKSMALLQGKPFLEYQLSWLKKNGFREIILCTGYLSKMIEAYFGCGEILGLRLYYAKEETPLGTAGALKNAASFVDGAFLVVNGDTLIDLELSTLISFHQQKTGTVTLVLARTGQPGSYGQVAIDQEARIVAFLEKPRTNFTSKFVNAGIYLMEPAILQYIPDHRKVSLELETFPLLVRKRELFTFPVDTTFVDIGTPENYYRLQEEKGVF